MPELTEAELRKFYDEVGAAIASEGPHTLEHLIATAMLGKHTAVVGRSRLARLHEMEDAHEPLVAACNEVALWLRRLREQMEHRDVLDEQGRRVNGFAFAPAADWEINQKLEQCEAALAAAGKGEANA